MDIESFRNYCLQKPGATEGFPFDAKTLVFKAVKMFALTDIDSFRSVNLKCDPERAVELRETYNGVQPGYHMSKVHWNTVMIDSDVPDSLIFELVDHSYDLVVKSLTKRQRDELPSG